MRSPGTPTRGREDDLELIARCLDDGRTCGGVVLVEGAPGTGKSRILDDVCTAAARAGFVVGSGCAGARSAVLLSPLVDALFGGGTPLLAPDFATVPRTDTAQWPRAAYAVAPALARLAAHTPVLVALDDIHLVGAPTAAALHLLTEQLRDLPIVLCAAYQPSAAPDHVREATDHLKMNGAIRVPLESLGPDSIELVVGDVLRAPPTPRLLDAALDTAGNPALLTAWLRGGAEEQRIAIDAGHADLVDCGIPQRVRTMVQRTLARHSVAARDAVMVAAVVGARASFDHLAVILDVPASSLVSAVDELVANDVLTVADDGIDFMSPLVRRTVVALLPSTTRNALCRRAIAVLVAAGSAPDVPADLLATTASTGDRITIATLVEASHALRSVDVAGAARLSARALDLTHPGDERIESLAVETVQLLHAAGRWQQAYDVAQCALEEVISPLCAARLLLCVARMSEVAPLTRVEATTAALDLPLSDDVRAHHVAELIGNLLDAGRLDEATERFAEAQRCAQRSGDRTAAVVLEVAEVRFQVARGDFVAARTRADGLRRRATGDEDIRRLLAPILGELALALDRLDDPPGAPTATGDEESTPAWQQQLLVRRLVGAGRLEDASIACESLLAADRLGGPQTLVDAALVGAAARVALHRGDARRADELATAAAVVSESSADDIRRHTVWVRALVAMGHGDAATAARAYESVHDDRAIERTMPMLMADVTDAPHVVRIGLASGRPTLARAAVAWAERRAERNPGAAAIAAAALQARGLFEDDPDALSRAADRFRVAGRPLAAASALEDCGVASTRRGQRDEGIARLSEALKQYVEMGAVWDASRVRRRLRALGVRRRIAKSPRSSTGWGGLTDAEEAVARLVAGGLTNREVAARLYVSPHTASMHLRHVFTKLQINSRVELTRLMLERDQVA
jgi:DNA-binding CsgD family transcriptional regulator